MVLYQITPQAMPQYIKAIYAQGAPTEEATCKSILQVRTKGFLERFDIAGKTGNELTTAAIRKTVELRKTVYERISGNPHHYDKFSRVKPVS